MALAFLTREDGVFTIPKAASARHTRENAGADKVALSAADIAQLDAAFPRGRRPAYLPMI